METTRKAIATVTVVSELNNAFICSVDGRRIVVPRALVLAGSEVHKAGDRGRLVVPRQLAFELGFRDCTGWADD
jgi:hypothetical protein